MFTRLIYRSLLLSGAALLVWAAGTRAYADIYQHFATSQLASGKASSSPQPKDGDILGKLEVPRLDVSVIVLQGVGDDTLAIAAGHVPETPLPGVGGNAVLAAHRDTFFRELRSIVTGDRIRFSTPGETIWYSVTTAEIVPPSDLQVLSSHGDDELTLITCYPFTYIGKAPQRFIVHARAMNVH